MYLFSDDQREGENKWESLSPKVLSNDQDTNEYLVCLVWVESFVLRNSVYFPH